MAFKMKGFSGFGNKIKTARAKRLIRKYVDEQDIEGGANVSEEAKTKATKKMIKADRLLKEAGYDLGEREVATGATGIEDALEFAQSKRNKRKKKKIASLLTTKQKKK